ncbi:hypothetical protein [Rhodococcus gordoniae]|uniref:hypothetical protein n=1 Tax=Rhodococcus gordoniae TaxID=223392 RepID=UPI0020CC6408|nr:hypothetical protein [Rhodococcus gordoniae]UTT50471.1 hypothetical protein NMQ04_10070 [Rhodococcus gordoniae]
MSSPSLTLTVWAGSWLSGHTSPDDVIDALHEWAPMHLVGAHDAAAASAAGLPDRGVADGAALLLTLIRRVDTAAGAGLRLVLPAPGAVHALPAGTAFASAALTAGEGVVVGAPGTPGLGLVPVIEGPDVLRWNVFTLPAVLEIALDGGLGAAEYAMREAVRDAASALSGIPTVGTDGRRTDPRAEIAEEVAELARHRYPPSLPARAVRILDTADQVAAILTVAGRGGGLRAGSVSGTAGREGALQPLWAAVREARVGAVAAALRAEHHR